MKPIFVLLFGVISVAFAAIFIRLAEAHPLVIATYRLSLAALVLAPLAWFKAREEIRRLKPLQFILSIVAGAFLALHFALWIWSLSYTTITSSVVLVTSSPIFVAIASYLLFREKITRRIIGGIIFSIIGAVIIGFNSWQLGGTSVHGSILALSGAIAVAGYLLIGRKLRQNMGLICYIFLTYTSATVFLLITSLIRGASLTGYSGETYLMFALLALIPQLLGHSALNWSLRFVPATMVTIAVLGEPVGATILGFFILKEVPGIIELIGGALILAGIAIAFSKKSSDQEVLYSP
jgi:drug/metabolite transporter (DMT)-like permease